MVSDVGGVSRAARLVWAILAVGCECGEAPPTPEPAGGAEPTPEWPVVPGGLLSVGSDHGCVARGGRALCWGDNSSAQLGDGTTVSRGEARPVVDLDRVVGVAAGWEQTCAWRDDGTVRCWGHSGSDDLADRRPRPRAVHGLTDVVSVALTPGASRACAIHGGGSVSCFGFDAWGAEEPIAPTPVEGVADAVQLALHRERGCAQTRSGGVACWTYEDAPPRAEVLDAGRVERLSMDPAAGYALLVVEGELRRWTPSSGAAPIPVPGLEDVVDASAGDGFDCALDAAGAVWCWADADRDLPGPFSERPARVAGIASATALSGRCALEGEAIRCWGGAELWIPDPFLEATIVPGIEDAQEVAAGGFLTCARHADGGVSCWGTTHAGALGREGADRVRSPRRIAERDVARLYVRSDQQVCLEDRTGAMRCLGRLPLGGFEEVVDPTIVPELSRPERLLLDGGGACVRRGGSWRCYGGIAGVPELARHDVVLATRFGSCAVRDDRLACWAAGFVEGRYHAEGTLRPTPFGRPEAIAMTDPGSGATVCALLGGPPTAVQCWELVPDAPIAPVAAPGLEGARALALMGRRVCGLVGEGNVRCVPYRTFPEIAFEAPHEVRGIGGATALVAGTGHACALLAGGRVACFGALDARGDGSPGYVEAAVEIAVP